MNIFVNVVESMCVCWQGEKHNLDLSADFEGQDEHEWGFNVSDAEEDTSTNVSDEDDDSSDLVNELVIDN